jgi:hypothetical protein
LCEKYDTLSKERGFSIKQYLKPTLHEIDLMLSQRKEEEIHRLPLLRVHFEAIVYLRLKYEAIDLSQKDRVHYFRLYKTKSPIATSLGLELIDIINNCNPYEPKGSILTQYKCLKLLNSKDLNGVPSKHPSTPYSDYLNLLEKDLHL